MSSVNISKRKSTLRSIVQLGLPAQMQRKAIEALALVEALMSPFFAAPKVKTVAK